MTIFNLLTYQYVDKNIWIKLISVLRHKHFASNAVFTFINNVMFCGLYI